MAETVSSRIREAQEERHLNNEDLAREIGVGVRLLAKWRAGDSVPTHENLFRLARVLGKPMAWFFTEDGHAPDEAVA